MANPIETVIELAKKGDKRVLIGGAVAVGGTVGLIVYLRNRNASPNAGITAMPDPTMGAGGGGGGGGGGGDLSGLDPSTDLVPPDLGLPTLPDLTLGGLPPLEEPAPGLGMPKLDPYISPAFPELPTANPFSGGFPALPSLPAFEQPQSYTGGTYGNNVGSSPTLPAQSAQVDSFRASSTPATGRSERVPPAEIITGRTQMTGPGPAEPVGRGQIQGSPMPAEIVTGRNQIQTAPMPGQPVGVAHQPSLVDGRQLESQAAAQRQIDQQVAQRQQDIFAQAQRQTEQMASQLATQRQTQQDTYIQQYNARVTQLIGQQAQNRVIEQQAAINQARQNQQVATQRQTEMQAIANQAVAAHQPAAIQQRQTEQQAIANQATAAHQATQQKRTQG